MKKKSHSLGTISFLLTMICWCWCGQSAIAFTITPALQNPDAWTSDEQAVIQQAISSWTSRLVFADGNDQDIPITFYWVAAGTGGYLAQWQFLEDSSVPFPYSPGITQYVALNSSLLASDSFDLNGPAPNQYDMLTVIEHELGHAMGFAPGVYDNWSSHISNGVFDPGGLNVPMAADGAHVNLPTDLMYSSLGTGVRRDISNIDLAMLSLAYGYSVTPTPEPASLSLLALATASLCLRRSSRKKTRPLTSPPPRLS